MQLNASISETNMSRLLLPKVWSKDGSIITVKCNMISSESSHEDCLQFRLPSERLGIGGDEQTLQQTYSLTEVQVAFKVLMTHLFCNSHDVSHFAAFFIDVGAKTSIAESVFSLF